jgi:CheY-like chemotaxis protein
MIYIDADPARFAQIFSNLLTNAAKYTDPGGKIRVHARLEGSNVVITVGDNGAGISRDQLPRVFDLFSQMSTFLEPSEGRLGIGLFLVRNLVSLHGGSIEARSDGSGKGSEFIVTLPAKSISTELYPADVPLETQTLQQNGFRVLVVDDNRDNADSCEILLHDAGFEARTAYSVSEALLVAEEFRPQSILLNVEMPGIDRYEVVKRIRATDAGKSVVLIAVAGWGQEDDKRQAEAAGFDHHVKKPIDFANLQHLLESSRRNR